MLFSRPQQLPELTIEPPAENRDDPEGILFTLDHEDGRDHLITTMSSLSFQASYDSRDESEFSFSRLDDAREESERAASRSNTSKEVGGVVDTLRKMRMTIEDKPELIDHISVASKESSFSQVRKKGPKIPRFFSRDDRKTRKLLKSKIELPPRSPSFKPIVRNRKSGQPATLGRDKLLVPMPPRHSKDTIVPQEEVRVFNDGNATEVVLPESMNGNFADDCSKATDISSALGALREMRQIVATNSNRNESEKKKKLTGSRPSKGFLNVVNDMDETVQGRSNGMDENIADDQHSKASDMHTALHALREMRQTITTNCNFDEDAKREMSSKVSVIDTRDTKAKTGTFKIEVKKSVPPSTEDSGQIKFKTGRKQVEDPELIKAVTNEGNRSMDDTSANDLEIDKDSDPLSFEQGQVELVLDPTDPKPNDSMGIASAFVSIVTNSIEGFTEQSNEKLAIQQEESESGTTGHPEVEGDNNKPIGLLSKLFGSKFAASNTSEKAENASARIVADDAPEDFQPEPCSQSVSGLETSMLEATHSNSVNDRSSDAMYHTRELNDTAPECPDEEGREYFQQDIKTHEDHFSRKEVEVTHGIEDTGADRSSIRSISAVEVADKRVEAEENELSSPISLEENQKELAKSTVIQPEVEVTISGGQPSIGKTVDIAFEGGSHKMALLQDPPKTTVKDVKTSKSKNKKTKTESKRRKGDKNKCKLKRKPRHELPLEYSTRGVTKKSTRKRKTKQTKEPTKISDTEKHMSLSALVFREDTGGTSHVSEETKSAGANETEKQNDATKDEYVAVFEGKVDNSCESDQANAILKYQNITNKVECSRATQAPTNDEESTDDDSADIYHLKEEKESRRDTSCSFERPQPKRHYTEIYPVASARSRNTKNASTSGHAFIASSQEKAAEEIFMETETMNPSSYAAEAISRRASSDDSERSSIFQANSRSYDSWDPSRRAGVEVWRPDSSTHLFTDDLGEMGGLGLVESLSVFEDDRTQKEQTTMKAKRKRRKDQKKSNRSEGKQRNDKKIASTILPGVTKPPKAPVTRSEEQDNIVDRKREGRRPRSLSRSRRQVHDLKNNRRSSSVTSSHSLAGRAGPMSTRSSDGSVSSEIKQKALDNYGHRDRPTQQKRPGRGSLKGNEQRRGRSVSSKGWKSSNRRIESEQLAIDTFGPVFHRDDFLLDEEYDDGEIAQVMDDMTCKWVW